jgi:hypothetical protein
MSNYTLTNSASVSAAYRFGYKWNVNECLRLQREIELLKLSVPEIAALHGRTINAIMYKIDLEGFATFNDLYVQTYGQEQEEQLYLQPADLESDEDESDDDEDYEEESDDDDDSDEDDGSNKHYLHSQVKNLYSQVKRIQTQITAILGYLSKGASAAVASSKCDSLDSYGGI